MAEVLGMKIEYYQRADLSTTLAGAPLPVVVLPVFSQLQRTKSTTESDTSTFSGACIPPITSQLRRQIPKT
jgi:hypothetical protein